MMQIYKSFRMVLCLCFSLSCVPVLLSQEPAASASRKVPAADPRPVATFNGTAITEDDLRKAASGDLDKLHIEVQQIRANLVRQEQQILETNLARLLEDKIFAAEAAKAGITRDAYLERELKGKIKEPTQQDINAFYEENKQVINKPLEQSANQIRQYLQAENRHKAIADLADRLKSDYGVRMLLPPLRSKVEIGGSPSRGSKDAPVTIVEFSDFQCTFCSRLSGTLREVEAKYGDKVKLVYRQFPVSQIHPFAEKAAEASLCAADQNQFWQMHDLMFESQNQLKEEDLKAKAAKLKLDTESFDKCLDSGKYAEKVKQDQKDGYILGISGTPALFVNGRFLSGALPLPDISKVIDEEIQNRAAHPPAEAAAAAGRMN
jgi:protein-disulfide isomerase